MNTTIDQIRDLIDTAEHYRSCYFWRSPSSASSRRYEERRGSRDLIEWQEGGHTYTAEFTVRCSCRNVYASGSYTRDGQKTTLTAIKNSYNRLASQASN